MAYFKNVFVHYRNVFYVLFVLFGLLELLIGFGVYTMHKSDAQYYLKDTALETKTHSKMVVLQLKEIAQILYEENIEHSSASKLMFEALHAKDEQTRNSLRQKLLDEFMPIYRFYKKYSVRQLHFHLPGPRSFLRLHRPQKYGDSLQGVRESLEYVNTYKKPLSCYEEGRIFNGFRNIYPLFYNDEFVGTVEVSFSASALLDQLRKVDKSSYLFLVSSTQKQKKMFASEQNRYQASEFQGFDYDKATLQDGMPFALEKLFYINKQIQTQVEDSLYKGEAFSVVFSDLSVYDGREIIVSFVPIYNLKSKVVAYLIHYRFDKFLALLNHKVVILFALLSFINLLLTAGVGFVLVAQKRKQELIQQQATHDALTEIYNRHGINEILKQKLEEYRRYAKDFGVIFCDIDFFKKINDTYGHDAGDDVLKDIAKVTNANIRSSDAYGRWGGEEFIIILPETSLQDTLAVAQKLRKAVEEKIFFQSSNVTCSFGVTAVQEGDDVATLIKRVDTFLYKAKETGRNKVVSDLDED